MHWLRHFVGHVCVIIGTVMTYVAEGFIKSGAMLADVEIEEED